MLKKYLPYIVLIAAALLLFWIKLHQRGTSSYIPVTQREKLPVDVGDAGSQPFNRSSQLIIYSKHARCRMDCRHIDESEIKEVLKDGTINYDKIESDAKGKRYPLEGVTHDKQHVRIVIAPHEDSLVIVTVIDLDTEWQCNCK